MPKVPQGQVMMSGPPPKPGTTGARQYARASEAEYHRAQAMTERAA
jgi:hypothetical protein